eukprot:203441_1
MSSDFVDNLQTKWEHAKVYMFGNKWRSLITATTGTFLLFCARFLANKIYRKIKQLPPGPEGLIPFLGYAVNNTFSKTWHINVAMTYGPIVYTRTVQGNTVLINDAKIAKQLLTRKDLQNRDEEFGKALFNVLSKTNELSFLSINGKEWMKARQLMHTKLIRILNTKYVNQIFEESIKKEFEPYLNDIINNNCVWYPRKMMTYLSFNTVFQANFGKGVNLKDNIKCKQLAKDIQKVFGTKFGMKSLILYVLPFLKYSSYFMNDMFGLRNRLIDNVEYLIEKRRNENIEYRDVDDMTFIDYNEELRKTNKISHGREIADIILMFVVGTDTTALTMEYGLVLLAKQPEIQYRVRNELLSVLKKKKKENKSSNILFDINLLLQLPLFRSLIHEIIRISNIAKLGVQHYLNKDIWWTMDNGIKYRFPAKSVVVYNVDYIHNYSKSENWRYDLYGNDGKNNQKIICLENWLKSNGSFFMNESFIAFGYGARDCVGSQLAKKEMRIVFAYILLNYELSLQNPNQEIKTIGGDGIGVNTIHPPIPVVLKKI